VLPNITSNSPVTRLDTTTWNLPKDIQLADEHFDKASAIDLLIGADLFYEILLCNRQTREGHPVLQETVLGWIVSGKTPVSNAASSTQRSFLLRENTPLEAKLNRFWEIEPEKQVTFTPDQQACEQHFVNHTTQQDGRFVVRLPLKEDPSQLGTSRCLAESRLLSIERRLERDAELKAQYHQFMTEYKYLGYMTPVTTTTGTKPCYYLPYHPVI
jgi:hypothetical protein